MIQSKGKAGNGIIIIHRYFHSVLYFLKVEHDFAQTKKSWLNQFCFRKTFNDITNNFEVLDYVVERILRLYNYGGTDTRVEIFALPLICFLGLKYRVTSLTWP